MSRFQKLEESSNFSIKFRVMHKNSLWILFNDNEDLSELKIIFSIKI
jgi:hypothetical protein